jgi:hypothetical protein
MVNRRKLLLQFGISSIGSLNAGKVDARSSVNFTYGMKPDFMCPVDGTVYVAISGNDTNSGQRESPLRTIQAGVDKLSSLAGGSLVIRGGVYREHVNLDKLQGSPHAPFKIHRYGQERVVISAAEKLTGWRTCSEQEALKFGTSHEHVFVAQIQRSSLEHNSQYALNLYEAEQWCSIATDRADTANLESAAQVSSFYRGDFKLCGDGNVCSIVDQRLIGAPQGQLQEGRILVYHRPNFVGTSQIDSFDAATGTLELATKNYPPQISGNLAKPLYALQNVPRNLQKGQWFTRANGDNIEIFLKPRDPANLEDAVEYSARTVCVDIGSANYLELVGLEFLRASGESRLDGVCLRAQKNSRQSKSVVRIDHCLFGENHSAQGTGYGALYLRDMAPLIHNVTIRSCNGSYGLFLLACEDADIRYLHISGVSKSPARFFTLRRSIFAFSKLENSGFDAHSNKFNFYEGSDLVLVYGVKTIAVGGYVTYQEASRIHFGFCEFNCAISSENRTLVSQNRRIGKDQGGVDGTGEPVLNSTFYYWNNSFVPDPAHRDPANSLQLGPDENSQNHVIVNNRIHGGGFSGVSLKHVDPARAVRNANCYTGLSYWQSPRKNWELGPNESIAKPNGQCGHAGVDFSDTIKAKIAPLFPNFADWDKDVHGNLVNWRDAPVGCSVS